LQQPYRFGKYRLKEANAKSILLLAMYTTHFEVVIHQESVPNLYLQILLFKVCRNLVVFLFLYSKGQDDNNWPIAVDLDRN
jgi:hypothetical protein